MKCSIPVLACVSGLIKKTWVARPGPTPMWGSMTSAAGEPNISGKGAGLVKPATGKAEKIGSPCWLLPCRSVKAASL